MTSRVEDGRDDLPFMVHSELDDIGLDPFEFRVYAHAVRRAGGENGELWESVEAGAKHCRMDVKTYRAALVTLVKLRLLTREDRPGQTSVYRLTPRSAWLATPTKNGRATESGRGTGNGRGTPTGNGRTPLPETVDKGNPQKGIPGRESQKIRAREKQPAKPAKKPSRKFNPAEVPLPEYVSRQVWADFVGHRSEIRKPLTANAVRLILADLAKYPADANEMLATSVKRGWTGVFALDKPRSAAAASRDLPAEDDFKNPVDAAELLGTGRL